MHRTIRSARPAAALALAGTLAVAATLVVPGAAFAGTTEPTGTTATTSTTSATPPPATTTTTASDPATTSTTTPPPATTSTDPASTSTTSSTTSPTTPSTTSAPTKAAARAKTSVTAKTSAASTALVPFGAPSSLRAALVPGDSSDQAAYAGGFLVRTLADGADHYVFPESGGFPDPGNTIDGILGLDGAGVGHDQADASVAWLAGNVGGYTGSDFDSLYASSIAKTIIGVVAHGGDPTAFGGEDLLSELESTLGTVTPGRFSDKDNCGDTDPTTSCDYSITLGQALALIAIGRATGSVPQAAVDFLVDQQCADGGFRSELGAAGGACTSDADTTAFAAQALVGAGADVAADKALAFLSGKQATNGGFLNQDGQYNANTAAVAAQAFAAGGLAVQLGKAQAFLAGLQLDCSFAPALRGGIAFTAADRTTLATKPTDTKSIDRALRATPQSTLALAGGSLLDVSADGAADTAPTLDCRSTSTTTTKPATSTSSSTTSTTPGGGSGDPVDPASAAPGSLALTGTNVAAMTLLATLLLLTGVGAIVLSRRKGVHA